MVRALPRAGRLRGGHRHAILRKPWPRPLNAWPTPSAGMHKQDVNDDGRYARWVRDHGFQVMLPAALKLRTPGVVGVANPDWVEWLMGMPVRWTHNGAQRAG